MLPDASRLAPGLYRWTAFHPEWKHDVASVALDHADGIVLLDPLAPPAAAEARRFWRALDEAAAGRPAVHVVLTLHYHVRSATAVVERYRARGVSAVWAPGGSAQRLRIPVDHWFEPGDLLPGGIEAHAAGRPDEVVLHVPWAKALVTGDVLLGGVRKPYRVCPRSWLPSGSSRRDVAHALRPLLDLDLALLVPTHGPPVTVGAQDALRAAVEEASRS
jgi:Metallo-beta-lactamase superfamily